MTARQLRTPILAAASLALSASLAFARQPPPPETPPGPPPSGAPIERQPPAGPMDPQMGPGMGMGMPRGMDERNSRSAVSMRGREGFHRGPGHDFHGASDGFMSGGLHMGPPGVWWKNPAIVQRLALSPEQGKKMDSIFQESRIQLIDLKATLEKQQVMLEPLLGANPFESARALAQIDKVAQARADLEKANARMLIGMRGVLTADQWTKLNDHRADMTGRMGPDAQSLPGRGPRQAHE